MPQKERYEVIIASKLESLPIPDMADAIWSRIEAQLDLDLPADDGGDVPMPSTPPGGLLIGAGLLAFVGALLTYFYLSSTQPKPIQQPAPETLVVAPQDTINNKPQPSTVSLPPPNVQRQKTDTSPPAQTTPLDTLTTATAAVAASPLLEADSSISASTAAVNLPDSMTTMMVDSVPKKKRGIQGLGDKDYRIVPQKKD